MVLKVILAWVLSLLGLLSFFLVHWNGEILEQDSMALLLLEQAQLERAKGEEDVILRVQEANDLVVQTHHAAPSKKSDSPKKSSDPVLHIFLVPWYAHYNLAYTVQDPSERVALERLLFHMYGHTEFYDANKMAYFCDQWLQRLPKQGVRKTQDLGVVDFENSELQRLYYRLLQGCYGAENPNACYPSLFDCLVYEPNRRKRTIDIHHAPWQVIATLLNSAECAKRICSERQRLYREGKRALQRRKCKIWVSDLHLTEEQVTGMMKGMNCQEIELDALFDFRIRKPKQSALVHHTQPWRDLLGLDRMD